MKNLKIAIVGATGLVGRSFLKVLEEKKLPIESYTLFASKHSAGEKIHFLGKKILLTVGLTMLYFQQVEMFQKNLHLLLLQKDASLLIIVAIFVCLMMFHL